MEDIYYGFVHIKDQDESIFGDLIDDPGPLNPVEHIRYFDDQIGKFVEMTRTCTKEVDDNGDITWRYTMSMELPLTATFRMLPPKISRRARTKKVILATIKGLKKGKHKLYSWDLYF